MNIFYLDRDTKKCAEMHVDKHCVKMILEYAQLLSTAHRVLDGTPTDGKSESGRKKTTYILPNAYDSVLYSATHINHPSAVWVRKSSNNYVWLHNLLVSLCKEYTYRYGKVHKCEETGLVKALFFTPKNIPNQPFTEPTPAMPDTSKVTGDSIKSYRNYYFKEKQRMWSWKGKINSREQPQWLFERISLKHYQQLHSL